MNTRFDIVDIHAHLLPNLDDGPRTLGESVRMCELYVAQGVTDVVATPHMCDHRFGVTAGQVRQGVEQVKAACRERAISLNIHPGGDLRLYPELI